MKTLKEHIEEIVNREEISDYDFLDNMIMRHCYISYAFNNRRVTESTIYESDGSFPGQHELVKHMLSEINKCNKSSYKISLEGNQIVDDIYVKFKNDRDNKIKGEYVIDDAKYNDYNIVRWDNDNSKFRFAEIVVWNYDADPDSLEEILYHETQHIWDDWILMSKKSISLSDKVKKSLDMKLNDKNISQYVKDVIYYSEDYEIRAYLAQINGIFGNKKYNTLEEAFTEIYKSSIYQNYKFIWYSLNVDRYRRKLEEHISHKEMKKIDKSISKAWKKIVNHAYHICCDHLSDNRLTPSTKYHEIHKDVY